MNLIIRTRSQHEAYLTHNRLRNQMAYAICILFFIGLIFSKFLISVAMIGFVGVGVFSKDLKTDIQNFWRNKSYLLTAGIFMLFFISGMLSTNLTEAMVRLRIALPLFFLPIAFSLLPPFSKKQYQELLSIFMYGMCIACIGVFIYYVMNFVEMQHLLRVSKAIPTPNGEHIRFSLMINLAVYAGFWLLQQGFCWKWKEEKWLMGTVILFLMGMLHLLSVRIGIAILYGSLGVMVMYYIIRRKSYWMGLGLAISMVAVPYLAYQYVPSIQMKVNLTRHNYHMYMTGTIGEYSDTRRFLSYEIAWEVAQQSPWIGVGIGDLNDEQGKVYAAKYPAQKVMYPHNFFLTLYAGTGILGLLFFLFCFFFPLFYHRNYQHLFFLLFYVTIFLSFMTENTLLSAIGVGIYSFFLLFSVNYLSQEEQ